MLATVFDEVKQNTLIWPCVCVYADICVYSQVSAEAGAIVVKMALICNFTNPVTVIRYIMQIPQVEAKPLYTVSTPLDEMH